MSPERRTALAFVLLLLGATLLAVSAIDWAAFEFTRTELVFGELHWIPAISLGGGNGPRADELDDIIAYTGRSRYGEVVHLCVGLALVALVCAGGRLWRGMLLAGAGFTAAVAGFTALGVATSRHLLDDVIVELADGTRRRWLWPNFEGAIRYWDIVDVLYVGVLALAHLLPLLVLTAMRAPWLARFVLVAVQMALIVGSDKVDLSFLLSVALVPAILVYAMFGPGSRRTIAAAGIPAILSAQAITFLLVQCAYFSHDLDDLEVWPALVHTLQLALGVAALVCLVVLLRPARLAGPPRLRLAVLVLASGVAAIAATAPYRSTAAALYPLPRPEHPSEAFHWVPCEPSNRRARRPARVTSPPIRSPSAATRPANSSSPSMASAAPLATHRCWAREIRALPASRSC